ncbi:MAG: preprotein translocase subunit SecA [Ardenticatenales bacterium]
MINSLVTKIVGDPNAKTVKRIQPIVREVNALEKDFEQLTDEALREKTAEFRARLEDGEDLDELLPEAFAAVREASKRTLGMRHFDVQIIGGTVLHEGGVAEMRTGEGKTLVGTLPLYLNALTGRGVHLVTPNDYLSKIGVQWMGPIYDALGMTAGVIQNMGHNPEMSSFVYDPDFQAADDRYQHLRPVHRREAYAADIMYGTNNEFGFDYLRDNMVWDLAQRVQRDLYFAIVDEVDNILIDEARTPLIISGPAEEATDSYVRFADMIRRLEPEEDFTVDFKLKVVTPTDEGIEKVERWLGIDNLYSPEHYLLTPYLENALKARVMFERDKEYIVTEDGEVVIVDEFTGRLMHGRRFSEGLHQAIEAKEGVRVQRESVTLATITFQNYFRMYDKLSGMTGTAWTEREELQRIYDLDVTVIPTHRDIKRADRADLVYTATGAKWKAVVEEIVERHATGQPILVGTVAVETSERLSQMLEKRKVPHEVLNAKNHEREAEIIAQAGHKNAVTIATNMAGRGVDILLGGNPEGTARAELRKRGADLTTFSALDWDEAVSTLRAGGDPTERFPTEWAKALGDAWHRCAREREEVLALGGLFVLGTERHEARRIDNQLRGRAGRQGDPGESRFFVAMEDDLMLRFGGDKVKRLMERMGVDESQEIESNLVSRQIEGAQVKVEGYNFDVRKHLLEYDEVINEQRKLIYAQRAEVLRRDDYRSILWDMLEAEIGSHVDVYTAGEQSEWDVHGLHTVARSIFPLPDDEDPEDWRAWSPDQVRDHLLALAQEVYEAKTERLGADLMHQLERHVFLRTIDNAWIHHLTALDELRTGIGLRGVGQEKPLVAFKRDGFGMFQSLLLIIRENVVRGVFLAEPAEAPAARPAPPRAQPADGALAGRGRGPQVNAPRDSLFARAQAAATAGPPGGPVRAQPKVGRNDPCWCGSGKKYKSCHMREDMSGVGVL